LDRASLPPRPEFRPGRRTSSSRSSAARGTVARRIRATRSSAGFFRIELGDDADHQHRRLAIGVELLLDVAQPQAELSSG
jgi:hypothetical protein